MILFVGSNPSRLNNDVNIPFEGSKSEKRFKEWAKQLAGDQYTVINVCNRIEDNPKILKKDLVGLMWAILESKPTKVVALGNLASKALGKIKIEHFKLPHPSPRNRFLNNTVQVKAVLDECKRWLST